MKRDPTHPIILALVLLCAMRAAVLIVMAAVTGESATAAALTVALHFGFTLAVGCGLLLLWVVVKLPVLRALVTAVALLLLSFSLFLSLSDPILVAVIGERLTPSTLSHFAGPGLFLSDYFWKPVIRYWYAVFPAVALLAAYVLWMVHRFWTVGRKPRLTPVRWVNALAGLAAGAALTFAATAAYPTIVYPVEIDYVNQAMGIDGTRLAMPEDEAVKRIRDFAGLPEGAEWVDPHYPLVYRWTSPAAAPASKPDIFIFVVESMRGESLKPTNPDGKNLVSVPAIEAMAQQGIAFRHFLSNGFPSGPGFVGLSSGAWMHPVKRLDAAYKETSFDRLGFRLRSAGYHTGIVTYDVRYDDKSNWVYDVFEDVRDSMALGRPDTDEETANQFIDWVGKSDATSPQRPLFGIFLTKEPHLPYAYQGDDGGWTFGSDLAENYARSIHQVDAQLGRAFDALKKRPRWKDTVIIIIGDHANFLSQSESTGLPVNDTVFTGAIISGGAAVIGPPRASDDPASQSDLANTILALAGDRRPAMALGRNLLSATPERPPRAVAIRNGGIRLDTAGRSMIIPEGVGSRAEITPARADGGTPAGEMPPADQFADAVRIWAWLIEHDRVWNNKFLEMR